MLTLKQKLKLCVFSLGIVASFGVAGIAQERIFKLGYGNMTDFATNKTGEKFEMQATFNLLEAVFYTSVAKSNSSINALILR